MGARNPRRDDSGRSPSRKVTNHRLHVERAHTDRALGEALPSIEAKTEAKLRETREQIDRKLEREKERVEEVAPEAAPVVDAATSVIEEERRRTDQAVKRAHSEAEVVLDGALTGHRRETNRALNAERTEADDRVEARDELFATISHDLRNLINVINLKSSLLGKELAGERVTARAQKLAEEIHRSTHMMLRWSNDLVDLASVETGRLRMEVATVDAVELVSDAVEICATLADEKGVSIKVDVPDRPTRVECDADRIVEVLINLIENATRHTARGGKITVSLHHEAEGVHVRVSDTGAGIPLEQLPHLFERYFQGQRTRAGVGMGLYICRHIVERHGGLIAVDTAEGVGSTFWFTLPRRAPREELA